MDAGPARDGMLHESRKQNRSHSCEFNKWNTMMDTSTTPFAKKAMMERDGRMETIASFGGAQHNIFSFNTYTFIYIHWTAHVSCSSIRAVLKAQRVQMYVWRRRWRRTSEWTFFFFLMQRDDCVRTSSKLMKTDFFFLSCKSRVVLTYITRYVCIVPLPYIAIETLKLNEYIETSCKLLLWNEFAISKYFFEICSICIRRLMNMSCICKNKIHSAVCG